jgi:hypothetical protein
METCSAEKINRAVTEFTWFTTEYQELLILGLGLPIEPAPRPHA